MLPYPQPLKIGGMCPPENHTTTGSAPKCNVPARQENEHDNKMNTATKRARQRNEHGNNISTSTILARQQNQHGNKMNTVVK